MSKKIYAAFVPLLAVAAFMVVPAMAQAETTAYGTCQEQEEGNFELVGGECLPAEGGPGTGNHEFVAFANGVAVNVKSTGTTNFVLENETKTADVTCTSLHDEGTVTNKGGIGESALTLKFDHCTGSGELAGCEINPPTHEIIGKVTDEVIKETEVKITVAEGFAIFCGTTPLGSVTGTATGTQAKGSNGLVFNKASGLTFLSQNATITGSDETFTEAGEPVLIN